MSRTHLQLYFQPKIDVAAERVTGYEILLRNTEKPPFYPFAKMEKVYHDQAEHACFLRWLQAELQTLLQNHPTVSLSLNFAPRQLLHSETKEFLILMKPYAHQLTIEITEEIPLLGVYEDLNIQQIDREIVHMLAFIQKQGYLISLDDVGTGQNSLERALIYVPYLHQIKFSIVKCLRQNASVKIVDSFLEAWHQFALDNHLDMVIEGIEDADLSEKLKQAGLYLQQGFYFGKPEATFRRL